MKKYTLILALIASLGSFAQSSHFALNMGAAVPMGDFASYGDFLTKGYAKTGFNLSFDGNYIPTWYFGFGGSLNFSNFDMNQDSLLADYKDFIEPTLPEIPEGTEINLGVGHWNYVNLLFGPTLALPVGNSLQINAKALFGMSIIVPPGGSIEIMNGENHYYTYNSSQTISFGYQFGTDLIYQMGGSYSLILGANYFGTRTSYDVSTDIGETISTGESVSTAQKDVKIDALHLTVGLAYLF